MHVHVLTPASSANLGPGFDCLSLALDLFNETLVSTDTDAISITVSGEGAGQLSQASDNLILSAMRRVYQVLGEPFPLGLCLECRNQIPLGSGLGSSASAVVSGLAAANALLGNRLTPAQLLRLAYEMEGHADNAAASLLGGLLLTTFEGDSPQAHHIPPPASGWHITVLLPAVALSTRQARSVLPRQVSIQAAVFSASRTALLVDALHNADFETFRLAMADRLHQPYRLALIPGAIEALQRAQEAGAAAALSGAGPSLITFCLADAAKIAQKMAACFEREGIALRIFHPRVAQHGARVTLMPE